MESQESQESQEQEEIDPEALQARIDLSMSLLDDLVSSWIKPSVKASLPKSNGLGERELEELMRRPPRCACLF